MKFDRVLGLVTKPSLQEWHLICGLNLLEFPLHLQFWAGSRIWTMRTIKVDTMWWRFARRTMCLLATGNTNCLRNADFLSMSKPRKGFGTNCRTRRLENPQRIRSEWEGLPNIRISVVAGTKIPSTFWHIPWTLTTHLGSKKDLKSSLVSEAKSSCVTTPLQRFKMEWTSTFTWRPAILLKDLILVIWAFVWPSIRRVPFFCLFTDWTSPICCWRSRAKRQALPLFNVLYSSIQEFSRNLSLLGKPEQRN